MECQALEYHSGQDRRGSALAELGFMSFPPGRLRGVRLKGQDRERKSRLLNVQATGEVGSQTKEERVVGKPREALAGGKEGA